MPQCFECCLGLCLFKAACSLGAFSGPAYISLFFWLLRSSRLGPAPFHHPLFFHGPLFLSLFFSLHYWILSLGRLIHSPLSSLTPLSHGPSVRSGLRLLTHSTLANCSGNSGSSLGVCCCRLILFSYPELPSGCRFDEFGR